MKYFDPISKEHFDSQTFAFILVEVKDKVLHITLNRERKKNALHPQMINELTFALQYAHESDEVWMVQIQAKGNVFCAGADLKAMSGISEEYHSTIPSATGEVLLGTLFNKVFKPTIAKVTGDVYAGGFFFLSTCSIVIAQEGLRLGLPEVKRGLFPFQVMESLMKVMPARKVLDWCIRGYDLSVEEAERLGLITQVVAVSRIDEVVEEITETIKANSPTAIKNGLIAFDHITADEGKHKYLLEMFFKTLSSKDGQEGLKAFREKRPPVWIGA